MEKGTATVKIMSSFCLVDAAPWASDAPDTVTHSRCLKHRWFPLSVQQTRNWDWSARGKVSVTWVTVPVERARNWLLPLISPGGGGHWHAGLLSWHSWLCLCGHMNPLAPATQGTLVIECEEKLWCRMVPTVRDPSWKHRTPGFIRVLQKLGGCCVSCLSF